MEENKGLNKIAPAITLMVLAPLLAEVLPGATRLSSLFVLPVEVCVWGGGALLIRYAFKRWHLSWLNVMFLALALSIAEEFLIQQTSVAPMVLQIKGIIYARAFGVNYVYLLWALIYEPVFVVFLPVYLVELIYPTRRDDLWIGKRGIIIVILLFLLGSFLAWYSWTQIARPTVFHVPAYNPPLSLVLIAIVLIACFIFIAIGPLRNKLVPKSIQLSPPPIWLLTIIGSLWAILLNGLVLLGFGILPLFPSMIAIFIGLLLALVAIYILPKWTNSSNWDSKHRFSIIFGIMLGSMMAGFIGFIGAAPLDLYFKIIVDILAVIFMIMLYYRIKKH
jgi:hypothetical protein